MDPEAYRKHYLAQMENAPRGQARNRVADRGVKLEASEAAPETGIRQLMAVAGDRKASVETRLDAIDAINRFAFDLKAFQEYNADYTRLLKTLRTDASSKVRSAAFQRLALSLDQDSRALLQKGLSGDVSPLVPEKTAITLLGIDDHASSRAALRAAAQQSDESTRRAALRGLAADTNSAPLLERIAADSAESAPVRETAALSLKVASPKRFVKLAKKLALDDGEVDRLRATAVSALAHNAETRQLASSDKFNKELEQVSQRTSSRALKASIGRFRTLAK